MHSSDSPAGPACEFLMLKINIPKRFNCVWVTPSAALSYHYVYRWKASEQVVGS